MLARHNQVLETKVSSILENELEVADNVIKHILRIVSEGFGLGLWQRQTMICQFIPGGYLHKEPTRMVFPEHSRSLKQFAA